SLTDDEDPAPDTAAVRRDGGRRLPLLRLAPDPEIAGEDGLAEEEVAVMVRERVQHVGPRRDRRDERPDLLGGRAPGTLLQRPGQDHGLAPTVEEPDGLLLRPRPRATAQAPEPRQRLPAAPAPDVVRQPLRRPRDPVRTEPIEHRPGPRVELRFELLREPLEILDRLLEPVDAAAHDVAEPVARALHGRSARARVLHGVRARHEERGPADRLLGDDGRR